MKNIVKLEEDGDMRNLLIYNDRTRMISNILALRLGYCSFSNIHVGTNIIDIPFCVPIILSKYKIANQDLLKTIEFIRRVLSLNIMSLPYTEVITNALEEDLDLLFNYLEGILLELMEETNEG